MKIVLITSVAGNGGSAATAFHNTQLLAAAGEEPALFTPGDYWPERGAKEGLRVLRGLELRRGFRPLSFLRDFKTLRKHILAEQIGAVIVQKSPEQWLAFFVLKSIKQKIKLVRLRGVVFPVRPGFFNRWIHNSMDAILCSAGVIAEGFKKLPGFKQDHVHILLEGIDPRKYCPASVEEKAAARRELTLDPTAYYFGTAGRPAPVKGHDVLVRAFAKALKGTEGSNEGFRLAIFSDESRRGPGSYENLNSLCEELNVADRVDLRPGFMTDMRPIYRAIDAYVLASRGSEGSSRAGLEARASGLPLIASNVGVLPDLIKDGVNGRMVPPDDDKILGSVLADVIRDSEMAAKWGQAARAITESEFTEVIYSNKLIGYLKA